jgi:hypothetical protein
MRELHCYLFFFVCEALGHGREEFRAFTHFPFTHATARVGWGGGSLAKTAMFTCGAILHPCMCSNPHNV